MSCNSCCSPYLLEGFGLSQVEACLGNYLCQYSHSLLITNKLFTNSQQCLTGLTGKLRLINPGASFAHTVRHCIAVPDFLYFK